jgi:hypothetical protein
MQKTTLEKFSVSAIADQIGAVGVESARDIGKYWKRRDKVETRAHFLPDYQPPNETNKTPKKKQK